MTTYRKGTAGSVWLVLVVFMVLAQAALVGAQSPAKKVPESTTPEQYALLEQSLRDGLPELEKTTLALKERLNQEKDALALLQQGTTDLVSGTSANHAALATAKLPLAQAAELVEDYKRRAGKTSQDLKKLLAAIAEAGAQQAQIATARTNLQTQVNRLKKLRLSSPATERIFALYQKYQKAAEVEDDWRSRLQEVLDKQKGELERQIALLNEVKQGLQQYLERTFKDQILQRQEETSLREDLAVFFKESLTLPARLTAWVREGYSSGTLWNFLKANAGPLTGLVIILSLLLYSGGKVKKALRQHVKDLSARATSVSLKTWVALGKLTLKNISLVVLILWMGGVLLTLQLWDNKAGLVVLYGLVSLTAIRISRGLSQALFEPEDLQRRIIPVDELTAQYYCRYLKIFFLYVLVAKWGLEVLRLLKYPSETQVLVSFFYLVGILAWFAWLLRKPYLENLLAGLGLAPGSWRSWLIKSLRPVILLLLSTIIVSNLLGFQVLSLYISRAAAYTALLAMAYWLLLQMTDDLNIYLTNTESGFLARQWSMHPATLAKVASFLPKVSHGLLALGFIFWILAIWGVPREFYRQVVTALDHGLVLGPVRFTPVTLFLALGTLYLFRRLAQVATFVLEKRVYQRAGWDEGIWHTIAATVKYSVMTLGIMLALSFLGLDMSNLAIIAGALGLGIGFGLQNIVNNFVSGLILLYERPIKVGDMLVIDGQWGAVKAIRVRSTVFETFDRCVIIIPNSELVSQKIFNWTHFGRGPSRISLKVGVAYGSDVATVTRIITEVCERNERVLTNPPPQVFFQAYGESSLDFNIWVHVHKPDDRIPATHELNEAIYNAFAAAGIEIPFPQRDVHIKNLPPWGGAAEG